MKAHDLLSLIPLALTTLSLDRALTSTSTVKTPAITQWLTLHADVVASGVDVVTVDGAVGAPAAAAARTRRRSGE